jgi:putative hydrolase of the HAD superfamily
MGIEVIVLDFDGVMNASMVFAEWLEREHGITSEQRGAFFRGLFVDCNAGETDMRDVLPSFLDQWEWPGTLDTFIERWFELDDNIDSDMLDAIDDLRAAGIRIALATNQEQYRAAYIRHHAKLAGRFDALFFSCDLGCAKPDAAYFAQVAEALGVPAGQILFFDDIEANVGAACEAGWQAERFSGVDQFRREVARRLPCSQTSASRSRSACS